MTGEQLVAAVLIVAVAAALQAAVGFGFSLIAAPLLLFVKPGLVPGPTLVVLLSLATIQVMTEWRAVDRRGLSHALLGKLPGTVVGVFALTRLSLMALGILTGVSVLAAVAASEIHSALRPTRRVLLLAGALSGFTETTSSVGGPPVALAYRNEPPATLRATLAAFFVIGGLISLAALTWAGRFGSQGLRLSMPLLLGVPPGVGAARMLRRLLGPHAARVVLTLSVISAVVVLIRSVGPLVAD